MSRLFRQKFLEKSNREMGIHKVSLVGELDKSECTDADRMAATCGLDGQETGLKEMQMLFITSSYYKYDNFKEVMKIPMRFMKLELEEIQGSKEEIVRNKLGKVSHLATESMLVFIDDTSINLRGLNGFPGQYAKDFLGMGLRKVVEVANKVGTECLYSTILGLAYVKNGELITKLFDGAVLGDIGLKEGVEPQSFQDIFTARKEEHNGIPVLDGVKIGRYRAAEKVKKYLVDTGIYDKLCKNVEYIQN